ncbi:MAG: ATP-dependent DNA helicase [Myxococcales bacterium]|nr:ATP-dependent DNA helicase [Myxococcota bacterium]MDW8280528.1 ATP-dependent DNA helicase [Myxococcales bacterium]
MSPEAFFAPKGPLARVLPGYEPRPQQIEMAQQVAEALAGPHVLLCEAPTGTGKTLAYLLPAVESGLRVVVSTGTRHLQDQIVDKDLPLLARALGRPVPATRLKGIANYLCLRRFSALQAELSGTPDMDRLAAWCAETTTGDQAELAGLAEDNPLWALVSSTHETRLGGRCPFHEPCFVTRARRAAAEARIVVINHHLLCADLEVRKRFPQARLLPSYDALICDEAHQLEDVATCHFGTSLGTNRLRAFCRDLDRLEGPSPGLAHRIAPVGEALLRTLRERALGPSPPEGEGPEGRRTALSGEHVDGEPTERALELDTLLWEAHQLCTTRPGEEAARMAHRAQVLRDDLMRLVEGAARPGSTLVFWLEVQGDETVLRASPVSAGAELRERLLGECPALVFTSATLAPGGRFAYARQRLGLGGEDPVVELRLDSPFDYRRQALLYLPEDLPEPGEPHFVAAAAARMAELVALARGRAFLLFTSWRRMLACWERLRDELGRRHLVLRQGESSPRHLLERFVSAGSEGAVLFATASFWEGVDVAGPALSLVVMDKLPFAPPDDPLLQARCRRLEEEGIEPFSAYQVPRAALVLAQGFGRLVRHRGDRGVVALLDRRATGRSYGAQVLAALPPDVPRAHRLAEVAAFYRMSG